jgi:thymidylate synthase
MHVITARNVQEALPLGVNHISALGVDRDSRNGKVRLFPTPVTTVYLQPRERVIFHEERDANPFFHLFECLWMLAGRDDVKFVEHFVKRMKTFSDDGKTLHGAYGKRWLDWFHPADGTTGGPDQLTRVIDALKANPDDRRQVISMWDGYVDPGVAQDGGKDVPCNTHIYVSVSVEGKLDMTILCRSNDMVWGAYGANAVHFSFLQEYLAAGVGVEVGTLYQVSNNFHAYHSTLEGVASLGQSEDVLAANPYTLGEVEPFPIVSTPIKQWREDLSVFLDCGPVVGLRDPFFRRVAIPMWLAHQSYKERDLGPEERFRRARENLANCKATDWRRATEEWLDRREKEMQSS